MDLTLLQNGLDRKNTAEAAAAAFPSKAQQGVVEKFCRPEGWRSISVRNTPAYPRFSLVYQRKELKLNTVLSLQRGFLSCLVLVFQGL